MKQTVIRICLILLISAVFAGLANTLHPQKIPWIQDWSNHVEAKAKKLGIEVIPLSVALARFESGEAQFIDARPSEEFEAGHILSALSLPFQELDERFAELGEILDSGRPLIVYCSNRECDDAALLCKELKEMGDSRLTLYVDGFELWQKHGGPVGK